MSKRVGREILVGTQNELASKVLLCEEFTMNQNNPFKMMKPQNKFDQLRTTRGKHTIKYTRKEITRMWQ